MRKSTVLMVQLMSRSHLVVHLFRTVEDVDHHSHGSAKILSGLSLSSSSRTCGGPTHGQVE